MPLISLTDAEIVLLDGACLPKTQALVDGAKARRDAADRYSDLNAQQAAVIADAVTDGIAQGRVLYQRARIRSCGLCDEKPYGHALFKSGPRRGRPNSNRPLSYEGIELADRFVRMDNHVTIGGCTDCIQLIRPHLTAALADVRCQVPQPLAAEGRPDWRRFTKRRCTKCGWEGHDGEMGQDSTIMGDGTFPSFCPSCGAGGAFSRYIEIVKGFEVEEPFEYKREQRFGVWAYWPRDRVAVHAGCTLPGHATISLYEIIEDPPPSVRAPAAVRVSPEGTE